MTLNNRTRTVYWSVSLLIGFILWATLSGYRKNMITKAYTIPVYFENIAEDGMLMKNIFYEVNIQLRGEEQIIRNIDPAELYVSIDLKEKDFGGHSIPLTAQMVHVPRDTDLISITPNTIQYEIERKVTKPVQVRPIVVGLPADGFEVYRTQVTPPTILAEGPTSAFQDRDFVETEPIDVTGLNASFNTETFVLLKSDYLKLMNETSVNVDVIIGEETSTRVFRGYAIGLIKQKSKTWLNPQRVNVIISGPVSLLEQVSRDQIQVLVDCSNLEPREEDYVLAPVVQVKGNNSDILNQNLNFRTSPENVHVRVF